VPAEKILQQKKPNIPGSLPGGLRFLLFFLRTLTGFTRWDGF